MVTNSLTVLSQDISTLRLTWEVKNKLPLVDGLQQQYGLAGALSGVQKGFLLVMGGSNFQDKMPWDGGQKKYYDDIYVLNLSKNTWQKNSFKLKNNLGYGAIVSTENGLICIGGENEDGLSKKVFLLKYNDKKQEVFISDMPELPFAVSNTSAVLVGNKLYLAGGETATGTSNIFLSLDLTQPKTTWQILPTLPQATAYGVLTANKHGLYLAGGRAQTQSSVSTIYDTLFEFDTINNLWSKKRNVPSQLSAGTGIAISQNTILLFGGDKGETFHKVELLLAAIKAEKDSETKQKLIIQKNKLQAGHPGFNGQVLAYDIKKDTWTTVNEAIPQNSPVTTMAILWKNNVIIPCGEIRAGVRTSDILVGKIHVKKQK